MLLFLKQIPNSTKIIPRFVNTVFSAPSQNGICNFITTDYQQKDNRFKILIAEEKLLLSPSNDSDDDASEPEARAAESFQNAISWAY